MNKQIIFPSLFILLAIAGCSEPTSPDDYSNQIVLNAYLFAGRPIDSVYVQRTARVLEYYSDDAVAITGASVRINLMKSGDPTAIETTYVLSNDPLKPGRYFSPAIILPTRTYSIAVQASGYSQVTGTTTVPDTFRILTTAPAVIPWDIKRPALEVSWSPSRQYSDYVVSIISIDSAASLIDDFRSKNRKPEDPKPDRTIFTFNMPERTSVELPWLMFSYLGRHSISVSAIDENYYDFLRQIFAGDGGSLREIRYRLNGGIGVFASATEGFSPVNFILTQQ